MKKFKLYLAFSLLIGQIALLGYFYVWWNITAPFDASSARKVTFSIEKGESVDMIVKKLQEQKLISSGLIFKIYTMTHGLNRKLKAGDYILSSAMPIPEIAEKLVAGDVIKQKITIIEGWDLADIGSYLIKQNIASAKDILEMAGLSAEGKLENGNDFSKEFDFLRDKPKTQSLEGYLFPDTYVITPGMNGEEVLGEILANFGQKLTDELKAEIAEQKKTIFEIVTMASLIEKEVKTPEDKKIVSGILWKRLKIGMPLQVDATIAYITGRNTTKILIQETKIDNPYNTYKYKGLPIGPISNPGLESIEAAIYPKASPYLFYLSTPDGKTIFSKNLKEHNAAKAKYLK